MGWTPWDEVPQSGLVYTDCSAPNVPFDLRNIPDQATKTSVTIEWEVPRQNGAAIDYYEGQWQCEEEWGEWQVIPAPVIQAKGYKTSKDNVWGPDATNSFTLEDLFSGVKYAFAVRAHNKYGWSELTDIEEMEWCRTLDDVPSQPEPPKVLATGSTFARIGR